MTISYKASYHISIIQRNPYLTHMYAPVYEEVYQSLEWAYFPSSPENRLKSPSKSTNSLLQIHVKVQTERVNFDFKSEVDFSHTRLQTGEDMRKLIQ